MERRTKRNVPAITQKRQKYRDECHLVFISGIQCRKGRYADQ